MANLKDIEGIGPALGKKFAKAGIRTTERLLKEGAKPEGRKAIAKATGINGKQVLTFVNNADLFRVKGVGEEYSDLLHAAGVDTVKELSNRHAGNLTAAMEKTNKKKKLVRMLPSEKRVRSWISHAKRLKRAVHY